MEDASAAKAVVLFTCTFYKTVDDTRCACCLDFFRTAKASGVFVVVVDASPDDSGVREAMAKAGEGMILVAKQQAQGKKGAALREAASIAAKLQGVDPESTWLCWQEPEKSDMARHWVGALSQAAATDDIVVPYRDRGLFESTYPCEQFHSESYGNMWLDCAAKELSSEITPTYRGLFTSSSSSTMDLPLDWHFGPFALRAKHVAIWTAYTGELWDAQTVPIVYAARQGLTVRSITVEFEAPAVMKEEEEGNLAFVEKRIMQLNYMDPKIKSAWTEEMGECISSGGGSDL
jgi:hypothetical protein